MQYLLAGLILWLGRGSTKSLLAALILGANAFQSLATLSYNLARRSGQEDFLTQTTTVTGEQWAIVTEWGIAVAVGLLALSLVRHIPRKTVMLAWVIPGFLWPVLGIFLWPGNPRTVYHFVSLPLPYVFAMSLVVTCCFAIPHTLKMVPSSGRVYRFLLIAAVLVPMAQQHIWYLFGAIDGDFPPYYDQVVELVTIGIVSGIVLLWCLFRLAQEFLRSGDRAALGLALAVIASLLFAVLRKYGPTGDAITGHVPSATQIFAQVIRPALLMLAFARFEYVRFSPRLLRPLSLAVSTLFAVGIFVVVLFISNPVPYTTYELEVGPAMVGLSLAALTSMVLVPRMVYAINEASLEADIGGRGLRLERYRAALVAGDSRLPKLKLELGISQREHEALESVLKGNLVIPEIAARGLRPGDNLEGYEVLRTLGQGGQGVVVQALSPNGQMVVIKQVRDAWAADAKARIQALRKESRASAGWSEVLELPFSAYLVRPYVPGVPLSEATEVDASKIFKDLSRQLAEMHGRGWVHGDVKPNNIIVRPDGHAVLIDEGAATDADETQSMVLGSMHWASPEQLRGKSEPASDVYQLGLVLQPYATGKLASWVQQALDVNPAKRPKL